MIRLTSLTVLTAVALAGCGGGDNPTAGQPAPQPPVAVTPPPTVTPPTVSPQPPVVPPTAPPASPVTKVTELMSSPRAMQSIAFHKGSAFVSYFNSETEGTAVVKASESLTSAAKWTPVNLGKCAIGKISESSPGARWPTLKQVNGSLWMMQHYDGNDEHSLCEIDEQGASFVPKDEGLHECNSIHCITMSPTDLKGLRNRLIGNAGGGWNVQLSETAGSTWRVLMGELKAQACYEAKFEIIGDRLLIGGECPLDSAYLRAFPIEPYTLYMKSQTALPIELPDLQNRNIQFIERIAGTDRVFVGVEGGLMRSEDGGKSFKYVIHHALSQPEIIPVRVGSEASATYPYIWKIVSPSNQPNVIVVAGFDKPNTRPYLAWSSNGGDTWTDISDQLPGFAARTGGQVTELVEGPQGQLVLTVNEEYNGKGHLMQLTLAK
ncbi:hypothetical protein ACHMW6_29205 [Pseudoduganella sp. UC29_106]|uniref:hypothetical protein n=1 Tax=Pseudoduganella sp. UC29_106 TaxID=3374553 RepID=UPI003756CC4B